MSIVVGPWGGNGGSYWDDGNYSGVREISLIYGLCIDSIRVVYDENGKPVLANKHGGTGGSRMAEVSSISHSPKNLSSLFSFYRNNSVSMVVVSKLQQQVDIALLIKN